MNQKFQADINQRDDITYIKLSGVIDEDNELTNLVDRTAGGTTVVDLADIERINSCGVRDWVNWLNKMEKKGADIVLVETSPAIVAQINLVNNFTGSGSVKSFYAPYFCPSCDLEKQLLVDFDEMTGQDHPQAPVCRCDECDGVMDFDDMEESYFAFIKTTRRAQLSASIQSAIVEIHPDETGAGERKVRSRVSNVGSNPGGSSGSLPSSVSLPSLPSVPSLPSLSSISSLESSKPDALQKAQQKAKDSAKPKAKTNLTMIVVIILLLAAIALLVYVILSGRKKKDKDSNATRPAAVRVVAASPGAPALPPVAKRYLLG